MRNVLSISFKFFSLSIFFTDADTTKCFQVLNSPKGTFDDSYIPIGVRARVECYWAIVTQPGYRISATYVLHTKPVMPYFSSKYNVQIADGYLSTLKNVSYQQVVRDLPIEIVSNSSSLLIRNQLNPAAFWLSDLSTSQLTVSYHGESTVTMVIQM